MQLERAVDGAPLKIPKSHPGHDPGNRMKILVKLFSIFYLWEHSHKVWYKIIEIDTVT